MFDRSEFIGILVNGYGISHWNDIDRAQFCDIFRDAMPDIKEDIYLIDESDSRQTKFLLTKGNYSLLYVELKEDDILFSLFDQMVVDLYINEIASIVKKIFQILMDFEKEEEESTEDMIPVTLKSPSYYLESIPKEKINKANKIKFTDKYHKKKDIK